MVMKDVRDHFRPEFLNRLDEIVVFDPLSRSDLREIVRLMVSSLEERLANQHVLLQVEASAYDAIVDSSYDPVYGGRPIRRYVERVVGTSLSRLLMTDAIPPHSLVRIAADDSRQLVFNVIAQDEA